MKEEGLAGKRAMVGDTRKSLQGRRGATMKVEVAISSRKNTLAMRAAGISLRTVSRRSPVATTEAVERPMALRDMVVEGSRTVEVAMKGSRLRRLRKSIPEEGMVVAAKVTGKATMEVEEMRARDTATKVITLGTLEVVRRRRLGLSG